MPLKYLADSRKIAYAAHMSTVTKTLKLPFLRLNRVKTDEFACLQALNTSTANAILARPNGERRTLTSKSFAQVEIGSAWINQTIRNANALTKVKQFRCLPLETNNQNWTLHKVGDTYSVSFGLRRGVKKRVPLAVHHAAHQPWLDAILRRKRMQDRTATTGRSSNWSNASSIRPIWPESWSRRYVKQPAKAGCGTRT
jgi:hypothetical protein